MNPTKLLLLLAPLALLPACEDTATSDEDDDTAGDTTGTPDPDASTGGDGPIIPPGDGSSSGDPAGDSSGGETGVGETSGGGMNVSACDPWSVDDCDADFKCMPYDAAPVELVWDANGCFPVAEGAVSPGEDCTVYDSAVDGMDDCDETAMCLPADFENLDAGGTCIAFCEGSSDAPFCANSSETCVIANDGVLNLCLGMCDPVVQDCGEGQGCYLNPTDNKFFCFEQDEAAAEVPSGYGDPCGTLNFCDAGLQCDAAAKVPGCEEYCCTEFCDLDDPMGDEQCAGFEDGQRCLPHFPEGEAPPGFEHIGLCAIPQ